jgi:hypothetical protein
MVESQMGNLGELNQTAGALKTPPSHVKTQNTFNAKTLPFPQKSLHVKFTKALHLPGEATRTLQLRAISK